MPALLIIGLVIILGGGVLFAVWIEYLWQLVKALLPLALIGVGGVIAYFGWEEKKDRKGAFLDFSSPTEASRYQAEALAYQEKINGFSEDAGPADPAGGGDGDDDEDADADGGADEGYGPSAAGPAGPQPVKPGARRDPDPVRKLEIRYTSDEDGGGAGAGIEVRAEGESEAEAPSPAGLEKAEAEAVAEAETEAEAMAEAEDEA
jgi:hypothetical protein